MGSVIIKGIIRIMNCTYSTGNELIEFDKNEGTIEIINNSKFATDLILFGGEKYTEPIVAKGPFVMNNEKEIKQAYRDFQAGKYGKIQINQLIK